MIYLRQSTASQEILLGPFVDSTDGVTAETGLTIANTDIKIWKTGATTEANKNSGGATHIASGRYYAVLDATDTDTIGPLEVNVAVSGALPVRRECCVLHANVYDWLFGSAAPNTATPLDAAGIRSAVGLGSANLDTQLADIPTVSEFNARTLAAADYFDPATDTVANVTTVGSVTGSVGSVTGNVGGNVTGSVGSISGVTFPSNFGSLGINASGHVSRVTLVDTTTTNTDMRGTDSALLASSYSAAPSAASVADAVWDEAISGHLSAGSTGAALNAAGSAGDPWSTPLPGAYGAGTAGNIVGTYLDAAISTRSTYAGADTSGTTTLLSRLSSDRAGYLDKLNVSGALAHSDAAATYRADVSGLSTLDAAGVRAAIGLASGNLDTQLADKTGYSLAATGLDLILAESDTDIREAISIILASVAGTIADAETVAPTIGNRSGTTRIALTTDADGNRSAITHTPYAP